MILVTGADGQLGCAVMRQAKQEGLEILGTDVDSLDITDGEKTADLITRNKPEAVIHCAAYTDVNAAESHRAQCERINAQGTENVARACAACGAKIVYISTDYVFDGTKDGEYETDDVPHPLNIYGLSKLMGENAVRELCERHFIVRISWLFGGERGSFPFTMLRLAREREVLRVVHDQTGSPTYAADLAPLLLRMAQSEKYGTYHATNEGCCTWYELAKKTIALSGYRPEIVPVTAEQFPTPAQRPKNSRLSKKKLTENGFSLLPLWEDAVERYVACLDSLP